MFRKVNGKTIRFGIVLVCLMCSVTSFAYSLCTTSSALYSNDFADGSASLNGFIIGEMGTARVVAENGALRINPGPGYLHRGYASLNMSDLNSEYHTTLASNASLITWAFNLSNMDGGRNNSFLFSIRNHPDPSHPSSYGYTLSGGGYVGDRMRFYRHALARSPYRSVSQIMMDIPNGLKTLPHIGAFKITYNPENHEWNLYFEQSEEIVDPTTINTLVATSINSGFTHVDLPYLVFGSQNLGSTFIDNLSMTITANALSPEEILWGMQDCIADLPEETFKNNPAKRKKALIQKINKVVENVLNAQAEVDSLTREELYKKAVKALEKKIRPKMDGSVGGHAQNDWITDPDVQGHLNDMIEDAIDGIQEISMSEF